VGWKNRIKLKKISGIAIAVCLLASVLFAGFTIYGTQVGNFVIAIDNNDIAIALTENDDLSGQDTRITVKGLKRQGDTTYSEIPDDIYEGAGTKNDTKTNSYMAFGFYLVNNSLRPVDYDFEVLLQSATKNAENAVRIMIIGGDGDYREIFAKAESSEEAAERLRDNTDYETTDFLDDRTVCRKSVYGLESGASIKYTVVLWLEGWDADDTDGILGASLKMKMTFTAY
jgi:hypothetical protein